MRTLLPGLLFAVLLSIPATAAADEVSAEDYSWLADMEGELPPVEPLSSRFEVPDGFTRVEVVDGSMEAWLRGLPIRTDRSDVRSYKGDRLRRPAVAVVLMDVGKRDLQQCADSAIRLHAEYLWSAG